ncbi:MAG: YbjN domain-containing protein [Armatimonadetes bacterium]|nr:YbjN domain-containing protein [Armatimonadota bacterium]
MKRLTLWVGLALLATSCAVSAAGAKKTSSCQQMLAVEPGLRFCADEAAVLTGITLADLKELCVDLGFEPTDDKDTDGDPSLLLQMGKLKVGLLLYGSLKEEPVRIKSLALQMRLVMREDASAERANAWNEAARFTRAYAKDKAYLLESDLDLEGGVTWKTISRYLLAFRSAAADFAKHVEFH